MTLINPSHFDGLETNFSQLVEAGAVNVTMDGIEAR
jgi:hypothetical protein